jgi:hypothetical protein
MNFTDAPRYIAYYRVSTARQGKSGLGLDAQKQAVSLHTKGAKLISEVVEIESGRRSDRPRLTEALAACRVHKATLVIAKLDRLARNVAFVSGLMEAGVEFEACDFPAANRLTIHILAAVAEHEARMISQRTRDALAAAKALSPQSPDLAISESNWLVMNTVGFSSEDEARSFAKNLKVASEISSVASRLGIDSGMNLATAGVGQIVRERFRGAGVLLRDNIHGIDVFPDDPGVRIFGITAEGSVHKEPEPFLGDLSHYFGYAETLSMQTQNVILLLNYALMRPEPVAQIIFAVSAVEMLGQQDDWSIEQKKLLSELAAAAEKSSLGPHERQEVADAINRGVQKLSLRQGVLRLLDSVHLGHLKKRWDAMYGQRSSLVHGLAPQPGADYNQLAFEAVGLCGQILLKVIEKEVSAAAQHVDKFYS